MFSWFKKKSKEVTYEDSNIQTWEDLDNYIKSKDFTSYHNPKDDEKVLEFLKKFANSPEEFDLLFKKFNVETDNITVKRALDFITCFDGFIINCVGVFVRENQWDLLDKVTELSYPISEILKSLKNDEWIFESDGDEGGSESQFRKVGTDFAIKVQNYSQHNGLFNYSYTAIWPSQLGLNHVEHCSIHNELEKVQKRLKQKALELARANFNDSWTKQKDNNDVSSN